MAGCPTAWLWSVFHGGRWDWSGLNLYQLVLGWLSEIQGKKKKKSKNRRRKKPQKTETQTNPTKIWGEGKEGKKKDGRGRKQEERGENEIKKADNEKKKGERKQ